MQLSRSIVSERAVSFVLLALVALWLISAFLLFRLPMKGYLLLSDEPLRSLVLGITLIPIVNALVVVGLGISLFRAKILPKWFTVFVAILSLLPLFAYLLLQAGFGP